MIGPEGTKNMAVHLEEAFMPDIRIRPARPWPVAIVTLKQRTLSPVAQRFMRLARECTRTLG